MTMNPSRESLIIVPTLLGTWDRYPFGVHYCNVCNALYDWWLGCEGCGRPPAGGVGLDVDEALES